MVRQGANDTCCDGMCQLCPYGVTFIAPCILGIVAMACTWSSTFGCHYFETTYPLTPFNTRNKFSVGPWTVEDFNFRAGQIVDRDNCKGWYEHDRVTADWIDTPITFVRVISMISFLVALLFWVFLLIGGCMVLSPTLLKLMIPIFGFVAICSILTLVMLASDLCKDGDDCELEGNGVMAILGFPFWIATAAVIPCMTEENASRSDETAAAASAAPPEQATTNTVEQTIVEEDGSKVKLSTTTTTDAEGNKTVTETREVVEAAGEVKDADIPVASAEAVQE